MGKLEIAMIIGIVLLIVVILVAAAADAKAWAQYKVDHQCKEAGYMSGHTSTGFDSSGNVVTSTTPGKTRWVCDDGAVEIWR